jgi:hypothetical protein
MHFRTLGLVVPLRHNVFHKNKQKPMPRKYPLMLALMATCMLIGCAGGTGVATNSQTTTHTSTSVTSTLTAASSVDFGNISVGATKTDPLVLSNQTTDGSSITVTAITVAGTGFTLSSVPSLPQTLATGQSISLNVTFSPLSAGAASGNVTVASSAANPTLSVPLSGDGQAVPSQLNTSAAALNFGNISVGATKTDPLVLSNQTTDGSSITVSAISVAGTGFSLSSLPSLPQTLATGQSVSFNVTFSPLSAGTASGNVTVSSNAVNPSLSVALSGDGQFVAGQLNVSPATLNFGNVAVGSDAVQTGALIAGSTSITVSSASWSGPGFSVSGITFPVTVPASQSVSFTVTFAPQSAGSAAGSISFLSNATNSPAVESFTGDGTQNTQYTVSLSWDPSTSQVIGYNVYRGAQSGGPYVKLTSSPQLGTSYTDSTVQDGLTYFYVSTSVNSAGEESSYSNQATAVIP